jgi:uncharacterized protein
MHSALYKGWVSHRRESPTRNAFRYRLFMLYLDLAELPGLFDPYLFWSGRRPALGWFRRSDYLAPHDLPLDAAVRNLVAARTGTRPAGPIRMLTHLRYFGYCFNPVTFYYCFDDRERLETIVAEITNTPWKERHQYVLPMSAARRGAHRRFLWDLQKEFHVSPFLPMQMDYQWAFSDPGAVLGVHMNNLSQGGRVFSATLQLTRAPLCALSLRWALLAHPLMTVKVAGMIHWQALRLACKRTPFHTHPDKVSRPGSEPTP